MIPAAPSPASPLLAHVEPLLRDARVLVVGNAKTQLAEHALARGARLVQVLDFDSRRVAARAAHNAERRISFAQLTDSSLRDAAFDLVVVEDLTVHRDPKKLLVGVRRSLAATGLALVAVLQGSAAQAESTEGRALSFEDLEDLAMDTFESVTLFGQAPFVGYSVVSLDIDEAPVPALDNGFLDGDAEEAEVFAALGGTKAALDRARLEDMTIVQLPAVQLFGQSSEGARDAERRALRHVENLEAELERLRTRARTSSDSDHKLADVERQLGEAERRAAEAERKLADAEQRGVSAEAKRREAEEQLDEQRRIAERSKKEARWAEERVAKVEKELEEALVAAEQATEQSAEAARLAEAAALAAQAQGQAAANTDAIDELEAELEETHAELLAAHDKLEKRARHVAAVEADLARVRGDLGKALERADQAERHANKLEQELATAGREASVEARAEAARLEAQLAERGRHVQELERQLRELEQYGRSLVARLETASEREASALGASELTDVKTRLGALERRLAEREADLVSAEWTIGQLEKRLGVRPS